MAIEQEKREVEQAIERARDGVSDRIDELDARLRTSFNLQQVASEHAPAIVAGGAVLGFLAGFGFPKPLRRAVQLGVPLALFAMKMRKKMSAGGDREGAPDYPI
jgi:hypothetical protein